MDLCSGVVSNNMSVRQLSLPLRIFGKSGLTIKSPQTHSLFARYTQDRADMTAPFNSAKVEGFRNPPLAVATSQLCNGQLLSPRKP